VTKKKTFVETAQSDQETHREQHSTGQLAQRFTVTAEGIKLAASIAYAGAAEGITLADSNFATTVSSSMDIPNAREVVYRELQGADDFRLIKVSPKNVQGLECKIVYSSLCHRPDYIAISYAWGDGFDKRQITLEGVERVSVNANLYDALMAVREPDYAILVWIDGLSIDQENKTERAKQVRLMDKIYRQATCVAIWLGHEADDSGRAIQLLEKIRWAERHEWTSLLEHRDLKALHSLFRRNYWSRLWVVQEVFHARSKMVYCGSSKLSWYLHKKASDALWQHESDPYLWTGPSSFPDVQRLMVLGPNSLLEVLRACRRKLSENPRDKIFGVLGILPSDIRERLHVSYDTSVKSLYLEVAQLIVCSTHRLDVMREAIHFPVQVSFTDLPTWCPNWAQIPENSALSSDDFSAASDRDAEYEFKDESRKLEISAIELDIIDTTGVAVGTLCSLQDYLMAFLNWRVLLLSHFNITEDEEVGHPRVNDFCKTLSLGQAFEALEHRWTRACYYVFSSLIQERFPRLQLDPKFRQQGESYNLQTQEPRSFIQKYFGDRMVRAIFYITFSADVM
jgi:hypothetical protein